MFFSPSVAEKVGKEEFLGMLSKGREVLIAWECPGQSDPESAHPLPTPALSVEGAVE